MSKVEIKESIIDKLDHVDETMLLAVEQLLITYVDAKSEIDYQEAGWQARFKNRRSKDLLKPMSFDSMISELEEIYPSLHDINLHVHRVKKTEPS